MSEKNEKLAVIHNDPKRNVRETLVMALAEHEEFDEVIVVALLDYGKGQYAIRNFYSGQNHLQKVGLLQEAVDLLIHGPSE